MMLKHPARTILVVLLLGLSLMAAALASLRSVPVLLLPICRQITVAKLVEAESSDSEKVYEGTFDLTNSGSADLDFSILASCACSRVLPSTGRIPPSKSQRIVVVMKLDAPGFRSAELIVSTNDKVAVNSRLTLAATWALPVNASPSNIDFGHVICGAAAKQDLQLSRLDNNVIHPKDYGVSTSNSSLKATIIDDTGLLQIILTDKCPRGLYTGEVTVLGPDSNSPLRIPVTAFVFDELIVSQPIVDLRRSVDNSVVPARIIVMHHSGKDVPSFVSHDLPPGLVLSEIDGAVKGQRCFEISGNVEGPLDAPVNLVFGPRVLRSIPFRVRVLSHGFHDSMPP